jgi:hypothetical protein
MKINKNIIALGAILAVVAYAIFIYLVYLWVNADTHWKTELGQKQAKWDSQHITHYRLSVFLPSAFLPDKIANYGDLPMPLTVEVKDGNVVSFIDANGTIISHANVGDSVYYQNKITVPGLFSLVNYYYLKKYPVIKVSYDPSYGFPTSIYFLPYTEPCCQDGFGISIQDFLVLP